MKVVSPIQLPRLLLLLLASTFAIACMDRAPASSSEQIATSGVAAPSADLAAFSGKSAARERGRSQSAPSQSLVIRPQQPTAPSMIIRTGDVSVQVDSLESSIAAVRQLAASLAGYIGSVALNTGEHQVRSATLEMKVPAARFDDAMAGMTPLGKVERSNATAEDVGEEFVDVSARIANAERLESRLVALLATRTGKLEDVLAVERELARVREEIERYEGRIRFLSSRIAMSTIMVTVHEKAPLVATHPGTNVIGQAFINMWRNLVGVVAAGIELLGLAIPVVLVAVLVWTGWKRWRPVAS